MKKLYILFIPVLFLLASCTDSNTAEDTKEYTGREVSYDLYQASEYPISGSVTFKERTDKSVEIDVSLSGTEGDIYHPVHLHSANVSTADAPIAVLLNDLYGKTGESKTVVSQLGDETPFHFEDVAKYYGSIKVHLASYGDGRDVILAGGNIGSAVKSSDANGRLNIAVCKSE